MLKMLHQCPHFNYCRAIGEFVVDTDGGSVRLDFWDTCGGEHVSAHSISSYVQGPVSVPVSSIPYITLCSFVQ